MTPPRFPPLLEEARRQRYAEADVPAPRDRPQRARRAVELRALSRRGALPRRGAALAGARTRPARRALRRQLPERGCSSIKPSPLAGLVSVPRGRDTAPAELRDDRTSTAAAIAYLRRGRGEHAAPLRRTLLPELARLRRSRGDGRTARSMRCSGQRGRELFARGEAEAAPASAARDALEPGRHPHDRLHERHDRIAQGRRPDAPQRPLQRRRRDLRARHPPRRQDALDPARVAHVRAHQGIRRDRPRLPDRLHRRAEPQEGPARRQSRAHRTGPTHLGAARGRAEGTPGGSSWLEARPARAALRPRTAESRRARPAR